MKVFCDPPPHSDLASRRPTLPCTIRLPILLCLSAAPRNKNVYPYWQLTTAGAPLVFVEARGGAMPIQTRDGISSAQLFSFKPYGLVSSHQLNYGSSPPTFLGSFISPKKQFCIARCLLAADMPACLPLQDVICITANQLFRFCNDECYIMPCHGKLDATENLRPFEKDPTPFSSQCDSKLGKGAGLTLIRKDTSTRRVMASRSRNSTTWFMWQKVILE